MRTAGRTKHRPGADLHCLERDFRGTQAVDGAVIAQRNAGRVAIDDKQADAPSVTHTARSARRYNQAVGLGAKKHHRFCTVDDIVLTNELRRGADVGEVVARRRLAVRPGIDAFTAGDGRQPLFFLRGAAAKTDGIARHHHRGPVRFDHQAAAQRLHHQQYIHRRAAKTAVLFGKRQAKQAHVGKGRPDLAAEAFVRGLDGAALLEAVLALDVFGERVAEHLLFFVKGKVHWNSVNSVKSVKFSEK